MALTDLGQRLVLIIDAKTDGAVTSMRALSAAEKQAAERADILRAKIADLEGRAAKRPLSNTAGLQLSKAKTELSGIESSLGTVTPAASKAEQALAKMGLAGEVSGSAVVSGLKAGAVAAAAFGGFEFLKSGIDNFVALAQSVRQFQQASGASAEDASRLVGISNALGVSSNTLALGMFRLGKQVALKPQEFAAYGISIAKAKTGNTDLVGTLENVAAAYQKTTDPAQRAAIVYEAFGRAGTTLLPILNATRQQFQELGKAEQLRGHILSQTDVNNAYNYQIATRELKDSMEALGISVAKVVVPALASAEESLAHVIDLAHHLGSVHIGPVNLGDIVKVATLGVLGPSTITSSGANAEAQAKAEQASAQLQAQQQQVEQAVLGTLAQPFDQLAGPAAIKTAKQTLNSALGAVSSAKREQAAAMRELAKAKAGSPVATSDQLVAAEARVTAAEASLTKARYIGGPGVASATASLASAQSSLNTLRSKGGTDTNTLANAEDRLAGASARVKTAQQKEHAAQKALNDAHGLNAKEVLKRISGQDSTQRALETANVKLAQAGLGTLAIENLDQLNSQIPGTLVKVADTMTASIVAGLNRHESDIQSVAKLYATTAANPAIWQSSGSKAADEFAKGLRKVSLLSFSVHPTASISSRVHSPRGGLAGILSTGTGITVQGDLVAKGATAKQLARETGVVARRRALGSSQGG